ncbi:MAG: hypothetical protein GC129_06030 [Proteobacteria bacterium]|nr:hypothetical protein [Pseudomonadota bacterium]
MTDRVVKDFMRDEEGFLRQATFHEVVRLMAYFRQRALEALTPQEQEFYADRVQQLSLRVA